MSYTIDSESIMFPYEICNEDGDAVGGAYDKKEALLFSASSDMLEALEGLKEYGRCSNPTERDLPNPEGYKKKVEMVPCGKCAWCAVRKAIKKARGES